MTSLVLTPFTAGEAVELGNRVWRKKVLPVGDVEYKGTTLHFTKDYLGGLVAAFKNRAYDQVPFQLADAQNTHTNDPERTRGEITSMELGDDGLYITAELTEDGEKVLAANPKLGVSARIVEGYQRSDGQFFGKAIQHVLGTLDPRIPGLGPWQAIEAASPEPDKVVDLSGESFTADKPGKAERKAAKKAAKQTEPAGDGTEQEGAVMADLTDEQKARLNRLLAIPDDQLDALANGGVVLTPDELAAVTSGPEDDTDEDGEDGTGSDEDELVAQITGMSDEELAALEAEFNAENGDPEPGFRPNYMPEGEPVAAGLSAEAQFAIDLARAQGEETARELAVVTARLRESDFLAEKDRLFRDFGIPTYVADLARPLLEGAGHVVEMANGRSVDAGQVVRKVMTEMASLGGLRDLSGAELGSPMDEPEDAVVREQDDAKREDTISRFKNLTGLK